MKALALIVALAANTAFAQSNLPACSGSDVSRWSNCYGTVTWSDGTKYVGEYRDGKRHGQGTYTWPNGDKYVGESRDDKRTGRGTFTWPDGEKYVGDYRDDKRTGQGTYMWPNGNKYVGEFIDGKRTGQGTFTWSDGEKYVGEFIDGKRIGQGTYTWPDGGKYVGEFRESNFNGQGVRTFADGRSPQEGIWENDKFVRAQRIPDRIAGRTTSTPTDVSVQSNLPACSGTDVSRWNNCFGTYTWPTGSKYVGDFKNGKFNGQGTRTWPEGDKYVGEYRDDKRTGQGTYTWPNGNKYVGDFREDSRTGRGTYTVANGNKYIGEFRDGYFNGQGTYTWADGGKYVGAFKDDNFNGQGIRTFADGRPPQEGIWEDDKFVRAERIPDLIAGRTTSTPTAVSAQSNLPACSGSDFSRWSNCLGTRSWPEGEKYVGEYKDGKRNGQGTLTWPSGDKYVGEYRDDKRTGQGTYTWPDGDKYVGDFREDKRTGRGTYTVANGNKYIGEFRDGNFNGQGTYTWPDGGKYVGEFRESNFNGQGVRTFADGRPPQEGIWENDKFVRAERIPDLIAGRTTATPPTVVPAPRQAEPPRSTLALSLSTSQPNAEGVVTINITTNSDTASLRINGDEAGGRADGRYAISRFAKVGSNSFEVIATDRFGNSSKQTVVVKREIQVVVEKTQSLNPTLISAAKPRDAVAIIIGIEKYKRVSDADFANNDASTFYDYARRALGIRPENIRLLIDDKADAAEILRAFKTWLPTRVNKNTTDVYVFYSGHGLPSEDGGSLYFLPHEVDRDLLERTAITQKEVVQAIQRTTPKSVTMFIDSCYSGQSRTGTSLLASARPISIVPKASTDFPPNFMVISASAPDQISSSSPELKHGIFSYYLMLGMEGEADENKDGQITVGEMQTYLSQQVTRRASGMNRTQSPQTMGDMNRVLVQASSKTR